MLWMLVGQSGTWHRFTADGCRRRLFDGSTLQFNQDVDGMSNDH
jgi:hypothetical protein